MRALRPITLMLLTLTATIVRADEAAFVAGASKQCRDCNLTEQRFKGRDLAGVDLSGATLNGAVFHRAKLIGAKFNRGNLADANFNKTDLRNNVYIHPSASASSPSELKNPISQQKGLSCIGIPLHSYYYFSFHIVTF